MKKLIALCLVFVLLFTCAACGGTQSDDLADKIGQEVNKNLSRGAVSGNVYTSEFADITFTKPDAWVYATDEEIAQTMNVGKEIMNDQSAYEEAIVKISSVYDMMVQDPMTGSGVMVMYENLAVTGSLGASEKTYLEAVQSGLEAQVELQYTFDEIATTELSGDTYHRIRAIAAYGGMEVEQVYYVRAMGKYMHTIIVTLASGVAAADVEAMFS